MPPDSAAMLRDWHETHGNTATLLGGLLSFNSIQRALPQAIYDIIVFFTHVTTNFLLFVVLVRYDVDNYYILSLYNRNVVSKRKLIHGRYNDWNDRYNIKNV